MDIRTVLDDTVSGHRMSPKEAAMLLSARGRDLYRIFDAADQVREKKVGNTVTFVRNQNIHITNICKNLCGFCGFGRPKGSPGAYLFGEEEIKKQVILAKKRGVSEICFLSGVHPDFTIRDYLNFMKWSHEVFPEVHIHAYSPDEVLWISEKGKISTKEAIQELKDGGLGSMQGTAAEILVDSVRETICPSKIRTEGWDRIIREAHGLGLRTSATLMYGSCETASDRALHLERIRNIQDDTGGFTEMVLMSYVHGATPLHLSGKIPFGPTGVDILLTTAVSRLFLDNFDHIQASWPKMGIKMSQLALQAGADDLSGTMYLDDVTNDSGGDCIEFFDPAEMNQITSDLGRVLRERSTLYEMIG